MIPDFLPLALGINRVLLYAGYVLIAGTLTFWSLVWPEGRKHHRLVALALAGIVLLAMSSVAGPTIEAIAGAITWQEYGAAITSGPLLLRYAGLVAAAFFLVDIVRLPLEGLRHIAPWLVVIAVAFSFVLTSNAVGDPLEITKIIATTGHILATAAWLGGLVGLAAVLIPGEHFSELDEVIPRFSRVAATCVAVLLITGTVHALAVAGGSQALLNSRYGLVFVIKILVFGGMLSLGNVGRMYAVSVARRAKRPGPEQEEQRQNRHALAVVMGAELAIGVAILATTSVLVLVAPEIAEIAATAV